MSGNKYWDCKLCDTCKAKKRCLWDRAPDWAFLNGCFGASGIKVSDVDGIIERNGLFFMLEWKPPDKRLSTGQRKTFKALVETGLFTILIIWGDPQSPGHIQLADHNGIGERQPAGRDKIVQIVSGWFGWVNTPIGMQHLGGIRRNEIKVKRTGRFWDEWS